MPVTPLPSLDRTSATFRSDADTFFLTQIPTFCTEVNTLESNVNSKEASATSAASAASSSASAAATSATAAANSAASAIATANATAWVNGGTYALNANAISQINFQTYRKITASSVTTVDPLNDTTNWVAVGPPPTMMTAETFFLAQL